MRKIDTIILHCSATPEGRVVHAKEIDSWHRAQGWNGIGYHYVVTLDGTVEEGRLLSVVGAHCKDHNSRSIGICYVGGTDSNGKPKDTRTPAQRIALVRLVRSLLTRFGLTKDAVHCHSEYANKACPCFCREEFVAEL